QGASARPQIDYDHFGEFREAHLAGRDFAHASDATLRAEAFLKLVQFMRHLGCSIPWGQVFVGQWGAVLVQRAMNVLLQMAQCQRGLLLASSVLALKQPFLAAPIL